MTRHDAVRALLRSLYDYLPTPKAQSFGALAGEAPSKTAPCRACSGQGHFGKKRRACDACKGKGHVQVDAYTGEPVGTKGQRIRVADPRRIDAEIRRLALDEATRRGEHLDDPFAWEAERIRWRRAGSYAALERALDHLRINEPDLYSLVMRCEVYRIVECPGDLSPQMDGAIDFLVRRMPGEIRVPRWIVEARDDKPGKGRHANGHARSVRDERIREMVAEGMTQAKAAAEFGLSRSAVSRIMAAGAKALA